MNAGVNPSPSIHTPLGASQPTAVNLIPSVNHLQNVEAKSILMSFLPDSCKMGITESLLPLRHNHTVLAIMIKVSEENK